INTIYIMKKLLLIALFAGVFFFENFAQAPQAVCYQAVAKDVQGNNLIDANITIRASVLLGSPSGSEEWMEVHNIKTDQFGLFAIEIGQGQRVGGTQLNFKDIDWGSATYWLRIEMDALGGNNFDLMGTSRIISVPYALYANASGFADEATHATVADSSSVAGHAQTADEATHAQVADMAIAAHQADTAFISLNVVGDDDGDPTNELQKLAFQNDTLYLKDVNGNLVGSGIYLSPSDADADPTNELQTLVFQNDTLFLRNPDGSMNGGGISIPQPDPDSTNELQTLDYTNGVLTISNGNSIELNSSKTPFTAPGASYDLPQGMIGEHIVIGSGNYQVPPNKNFWVTAASSVIKLKGYGLPPYVEHPTPPNMPAFPPGTSIKDCRCTGILTDTTASIQPVIIDFVAGSSSYTVPPGKILFIKSGLKSDEVGYLIVNGEPMEFLRSNFTRGTRILTFPEGTVIEPLPANQNGDVDTILTGFLIDKDF
ncbi:MAG: hypothetical protein D6714_09740, partial [Bacteroidetes bacterium]